MTEAILRDVERHERVLYGGNGEGLGIQARMTNVETFITEFRAERKEAAADRRKILVTVVSGAILQVLILLAVLVWTHPAVAGLASGVTPVP
jgi:hypothetical protein